MSAHRGAVAPTTNANAALAPLGGQDTALTGGLWGTWQVDNAAASIPHALRWLRKEGVVANFADWRHGQHTGPCYTDSDLYKTMEAMAWEIGRTGSAIVRRDLDELITIVARAQEPDGYINTYVQAGRAERWADLADGHELYCIGHLIQAGIAHRRATGDDTLLAVAVRAADLVVREFGPGRRPGIDGHEGIEIALVELFRETGRRTYLEQAREFIQRRGHRSIRSAQGHRSEYYQDATPPLEQREAVGHAVRATYLLTALADVGLETGDPAYLSAAEHQWTSITAGKWYITGALGSRYEDESLGEAFELPPDRAYGETCAAVGLAMASWRLLLATGQARYADAIERLLHNAIAASTDVERTGFFYVNPLQRRRAVPPADAEAASRRAEPPGTRPPWFETACCPPNVLRSIAGLHQWVATHDPTGVQIHQYMSATIDARATAIAARLGVDTDYPNGGVVRVVVLDGQAAVAELALRIPAWASAARVTINGAPAPARADDGYLRLRRAWRTGDEVELCLPVAPRLTRPHPAVDALRSTVAIERGPVVYCLESIDQVELDLSMVRMGSHATLEERYADVAGEHVPVISVEASLADPAAWAILWAGRDTPVSVETAVVRAIPYRLWANRGSAAMRVHIPLVVPE